MKIVLVPYFTGPTYGNELTSAKLRIEVAETEGVDKSIFLHRRYDIVTEDGHVQENRFITVAKPGDLERFPVGAPSSNPYLPPYFRLDRLEMMFTSPDTMDEGYTAIVEDVTKLVRSLRHMETIQAGDPVIIEG